MTFAIQKKFIQVFLSNSPKIGGLSHDTMFGFKVPFHVHTCTRFFLRTIPDFSAQQTSTDAALMIVGSQVTYILRFFLSRNIRLARDRACDQTVASRGKGPDFWQPYVEEWEYLPCVDLDSKKQKFIEKWLGGWFGLFVIKRVSLSPFQVYPFVGLAVSAWFKAFGTSHFLHRRYFEAKKMTKQQIAVHMEERKWNYRIFGFTAALLEGLPIIGLVFTVSIVLELPCGPMIQRNDSTLWQKNVCMVGYRVKQIESGFVMIVISSGVSDTLSTCERR